MNIIDYVIIGLETATTWQNLWYCFVGVFLGTLVGVLPGIGSLATIAMLLPFTFNLNPTSAIIMLAGVYYGGAYGGSTTSILLNVPGSASASVSCLDGYPMSKQGRGGVALFGAAIGSFVGATTGILAMMFLSAPLAEVAIQFGPTEYVSVMILGLIAAATVSSGTPLKGVAMILVGILLGLIGTDVNSGVMRYAFGVMELSDGIALPVIAMALFGVSEMIESVGQVDTTTIDHKAITLRSMIPTRDDVKRAWKPMLRGALVGCVTGPLPGTGALVSCFAAYAIEKKLADDPSRFGKGAIEGVIAPETANNANDQTSFIPTMSLGIPDNAVMALLLGALMIHGISPGPQLITEKPQLFWGLIMSFWIGNIMLVILNLPLISIWVRLLSVPFHIMYPIIMVTVSIGAYSINNNPFDIYVVGICGVFGYGARLLNMPPAPLLMGFVLGPLMEEYLRRAMLLSRGSFWTFVERPISGTMFAITALLVLWSLYSALTGRKRALLRPKVEELVK